MPKPGARGATIQGMHRVFRMSLAAALAISFLMVVYGQRNSSQATFFVHRLGTDHAEGITTLDMNGDGSPDLALAHYGRSGLFWVDFAGAEPKVHMVGTSEQDGHGVGMADVDGDGKIDLLTIHGWFKNVDAAHDKWEWRGEWNLGET